MAPILPGPHPLRRAAGAVGTVALLALGAAPAAAAGPAPGLVLGKMPSVDGLKPGDGFPVQPTFTNTGGTALDKVWVTYTVTHGLSWTEVPSNCDSWEVPPFDEGLAAEVVSCEFDQAVDPGVVYAPEAPLAGKALPHAMEDNLSVLVSTYEAGPGDSGATPVHGTGPAVKLVRRPDDTPPAPGSAQQADWDRASVKVRTRNTADFQVTGGQLKGHVGDTVPLGVKFTNAGPAWVYGDMDTTPTRVMVKMPAGTSVTKTDGRCRSVGSGTYECGTGNFWVDENSTATYDFSVRIGKAGAKGSVTLAGPSRPFDPDKANDAADITVDAAGAGSTGGGTGDSGSTSSTGGSGTDSTGGSGSGSSAGSTTSGSTSGSTGGSSASGGSASSATGGTSGSSTTGGGLAATGSGSVLPLTAAAGAAVALGAGTVLMVRRRAARQR
ncbi:hypothetical protein OIB37_02300 [Streptomyces sp. NBC_00820]|uniref:hypothetical protein n=1 Tax=Streptomyces sp. NBC_00820 TaxID=2975842 RepID=UPI002ED5471C|nr:hypothetical protein OIB37_02300 [Streptomyces sp. NBC_00820]